jgi:hypothetical protein
MTYESLELVGLGEAEVAIEDTPFAILFEELVDKRDSSVAPYVEFDE